MTKLRELAESFANKTPIGIYSPDDIIQIAYEAGFRAALEALEKAVCEIQLSGANSAVRSDIKQGHWMACHSVRNACRALGGEDGGGGE